MRFLIDAQLPPALAHWLRDEGHDAAHVFELDMRFAEDPEIWSFAADRGYTIVTKDEDFARRRSASRTGPAVVWIRLPNRTRIETLAWFGRALPGIVASLEHGEQLIAVI